MEKSFRGIHMKFGTWEYGTEYKDNLVNVGGGKMEHWIFINGMQVITETVGQMIHEEGKGLNTVTVFEGDVIELWHPDNEDEKQICTVEELGVIHGNWVDFEIWTVFFAMNEGYKLKIIKSIHDEKLKGGSDE